METGLPLSTLVERYRRAAVLVIPSEHESFCMPVVEAMACGVPVVVRDLPALREAGGSVARYVAGDDPDDWAAAIACAMQDGSLPARAIQHAAGFSWDRTAAELRRHLMAGTPPD